MNSESQNKRVDQCMFGWPAAIFFSVPNNQSFAEAGG
jgi:hypothetical protein